MTLTLICQLAEIGTCVATVALVIVALWQLGHIRTQFITTFEDRMTEQYRKLMKDIPTDVWLGADLKTLDGEQVHRCRDAIYRYIDLSNEQAFLHYQHRVRAETWRIWKEGIQSNMKLPAFHELWKEVAHKTPAAFEFLRDLLP
jgi:hypothetical protein